MASGRVHGLISGTAGVIAAWTMYRITGNAIQGAVLGGACLAGIILSPDLDEKAPTKSHGEMQKGLGITIAAFWWILWLPYALIMKRHRALLSHFPGISTIGRVGYLGSAVYLILWIIKLSGGLSLLNGVRAGSGVGYDVLQVVRTWAAAAMSVEMTWIWKGFLLATVVIFVLSLIGVDCEQKAQKVLFWILTGVSLLILAGAAAIQGWAAFPPIPNGLWLLIGLTLSDTLHALVDWYIPEPGWNRKILFQG